MRIWFPIPLLLLAVSLPAQAQEAEPPDETIDEITVVAPRTEPSIRAELIQVEEEMFDHFNSLHHDRDFYMHCGWENRRGFSTASRLKVWECRSGYEKEILTREFGGVSGVDAVANARALNVLTEGPIRRHREEFRKKMIELAEENPELANYIYRRAALQQDLAKAQERDSE